MTHITNALSVQQAFAMGPGHGGGGIDDVGDCFGEDPGRRTWENDLSTHQGVKI